VSAGHRGIKAAEVKVLITSGIFPPDIGGPATYVPVIANGLVERGHEVLVITASDRADGRPEDIASSFKVNRIRRKPPARRVLESFGEIFSHARDADVIYANGLFAEATTAAALVGRPIAAKFVGDAAWERAVRLRWTNAAFDDFQRQRQDWRAEILRKLRSRFARRADRVIVPSHYLADVVRGWGVSEQRCHVVYNAVASHESGEAPYELDTRKHPKDALNLVAAGRLTPWKGFDLLIQAGAGLPRVSATIVGDGPMRAELEALAQSSGAGERIRFTGILTGAPLRRLMREHDAFVLASSYEGLPHILLEAMQEGLPVIGARIGGIPEVVVDDVNGILIEPTATQLAAAIQRLQNDPQLRHRLAAGARRVVQERFSVARMIDETEAILLQLARTTKN
jgi:glycosyltransferase involved in cell wall biosynthesis